jgi:hypothetical protein
MPRYLIKRTFPTRFEVPADASAGLWRDVIAVNGDEGVTWVHSYVSDDGRTMFCVYDAPTPEAIRKTAASNRLPVDEITRVGVLDPYGYV